MHGQYVLKTSNLNKNFNLIKNKWVTNAPFKWVTSTPLYKEIVCIAPININTSLLSFLVIIAN